MKSPTELASLTNPSTFAQMAALRRETNSKRSSKQPGGNGAGRLPAAPSASSRSSPEWQELYFRWLSGATSLPRDANGNAVAGRVALIALPNTPGDGTRGHLDVTLSAAQSWVLPLRTVIGSSYSDGTPPDQFLPDAMFENLQISFEIGRETVVSRANVMDYYSRVVFAPPIPFETSTVSALIWMQVIGLVHGPLEAGIHKMKLDVKDTQPMPPNFGSGLVEFHNTWSVKVLAEGSKRK